MQEQNRFNSEEAKKNRDWQELMYRMFGTSSAKANDMRAAGLNALLGDVSASGNVGSGSAATAAESAQMMPTSIRQASVRRPLVAHTAQIILKLSNGSGMISTPSMSFNFFLMGR